MAGIAGNYPQFFAISKPNSISISRASCAMRFPKFHEAMGNWTCSVRFPKFHETIGIK